MAVNISIAKKYCGLQLRGIKPKIQVALAKRKVSRYLITCPIFYVNAEPHIGHLYTVVLADAISRFHKLKNSDCKIRFMVGTDEHGMKVSRAASSMGLDETTFCNKISQKYRLMFDLFNINSDDFIRTTEVRHVHAVTAFWNKIAAENYIYKDNYEGWYCLADEAFVPEHQLDLKTDDSNIRYTIVEKKPVQFVSEMNYKFKLSKFQDDLLYWLKSGDIVKPGIFHKLLTKWVIEGKMLNDVSVSRPVERVPWGISVPGDSTQTIYVWLDALSSYLCSNGYPNSNFKWPPDLQVIGKDILRFHGILWPAFLMAAGLEPPKSILCHCHWLKDGEKISKSKGNIIDPFIEAKNLTSEGFRYFLLREGVPHNDGNFSLEKALLTVNTELADTLGNLLNRCTSNAINRKQIFPALTEENYEKYRGSFSDMLINSLKNLPDLVDQNFKIFHIYKSIDAIMATLRITNVFFSNEEPWKYSKRDEDKDRLNFILNLTMESLRVCGILLQPIVPSISDNLLSKLSVPKSERSFHTIRPFSWDFKTQIFDTYLSNDKIILFGKIRAS